MAEPQKRDLDEALVLLASRKEAWTRTSAHDRLALLTRLIHDVLEVAEAWTESGARRHGEPNSRLRGEEWTGGPMIVVRLLVALKSSLNDIRRGGAPRANGPPREHRSTQGVQTVLRAFPTSPYERLGFPATTIDIRLQPGLSLEEHTHRQAPAYKSGHRGSVALVLGAGNVSSIPVTDTLERLFTHNEVVILKLNPVNDFLAEHMERALAALIAPGFLRIVKGGAEVGAYLCEHPFVESVHVTGSGKTFDIIVFGAGEEGRVRKARRKPMLNKPITAELGDLSPVIVVPGPWSAKDLAYQGHHLASMLADHAGFTCATPRLVIQQKGWPLREALLEAVEGVLATLSPRAAYYPGAHDRWRLLAAAHPAAKRIGTPVEGALPWTLVCGLAPEDDSPCFELEPFCSFAAEVVVAAGDPASFVDRAVAFANERLWGSLSATLLVHPASLRDPAVAHAVERAVDNLQYGTVSINLWSGISWAFGIAPWGAYPGSSLHEARSGIGFAHNPLMLTTIQKTVLRGPFRTIPTPGWFAQHRRYGEAIRHLTHLYAKPNPQRMMQLSSEVMRGWL